MVPVTLQSERLPVTWDGLFVLSLLLAHFLYDVYWVSSLSVRIKTLYVIWFGESASIILFYVVSVHDPKLNFKIYSLKKTNHIQIWYF